MNASRARGLFLVGVLLGGNVHAQGAPPTEAPGSDPLPTDSALPPPPVDVSPLSPPVDVTRPPPPGDLTRAQEQYDEQAVGFDDFGGVVTENGTVTGTVQWSSPYQGKYKKPLVGADFYRAVGRADLVKQYEDRAALKTGLMVGGGLVALAGLIAATILASGQTTTCTPITPGGFSLPTCTAPPPVDPAIGWLVVGGVVAGGGVFIAGAGMDPDPVGSVGKRQLAEAYNRDLWQRLSAQQHASAVDVRVAPQLLEDGAGVALSVRF
jgi:hypothetical protein